MFDFAKVLEFRYMVEWISARIWKKRAQVIAVQNLHNLCLSSCVVCVFKLR